MKALVEVLAVTERWFRERGVPSPRLDAELLLCHVLALPRLQLYLQHDRPLTDAELDALRLLVKRRGDREPLAWILGHCEFHRVELLVAPGVLVPRPDTETIVEAALAWIPADADPVYVADVGSGTGAIGLAVASERPGVRLYAIDKARAALDNTRANVEKLGLGARVAVLDGDLLAPVPPHRPIDWVLSNPPYVASGDIDGLEPEVSRWEPRLALDGGRDGLDAYRALVPVAAKRARKGVLVEVGAGQATRVAELFERAGLTGIRVWKDLAGIERVVGGLTAAG